MPQNEKKEERLEGRRGRYVLINPKTLESLRRRQPKKTRNWKRIGLAIFILLCFTPAIYAALFNLTIPVQVSTPAAAISFELREEGTGAVITNLECGTIGRGEQWSKSMVLVNTGDTDFSVSYSIIMPSGFTVNVKENSAGYDQPWAPGDLITLTLGTNILVNFKILNEAAAFGTTFNFDWVLEAV